MSNKYFVKFPFTVHSNTVCKNIIAKVGFLKTQGDKQYVYHNYTIDEGDRPETIAHLYYGDVGYDWIVYFSNDIVDPLYDWYMPESIFKKYIIEKYGSVVKAQQKIKFFRSNYVNDFSLISISTYNALTSNQKKYWVPITDINENVVSYERKKEDITYNSNITLQLTISLVSNIAFEADEVVYQQYNGITTASGVMSSYGDSTAIIDRIQGSFITGRNLKGVMSSANAETTAVNTLVTSIPSAEQIYFTPVSYYDYEVEQNEKKKNIKLLDVSLVKSISKQFENLLGA